MPAPLTGAIGTRAENEHADESRDEWDRADPADLHIAPSRHALEQSRHPEPKDVAGGVAEEQTERENDHRGMPQRLPNGHLLDITFGPPFIRQPVGDPIPFMSREPGRFGGPVWKKEY